MTLIYVLAGVIFLAVGVVGILFYLLNKESANPPEASVVPITDPREVLRPEPAALREEEFKRKAEVLEEELRGISEKGVAQAQEAMGMIDVLTKENQQLKEEKAKRDADGNEEFSFLQRHAEQLRVDNSALQTQLDESQVRVHSLQEEATMIRHQMGEELAQARSSVEQIRVEKENLLASRESSVQSSQALARELAEVKAANESLLQEADDLRITGQKLKEVNAQLLEKNQLLQYELTKNRAQASGLEKICANYKVQLGRLNELQPK